MSPIRHIPAGPRQTITLPGERPAGTWRYSSRLALVLSGGGARAAYQVGVLAGLAERLPGIEFPILVGVSAGAINISYLAAHLGDLRGAVDALREEWGHLTADRVYRVRTGALVQSTLAWLLHTVAPWRERPGILHGVVDTEPLRAFLSQTIRFGGIDANIEAGRLRAVALSATSYTTGRSITFVHAAGNPPMWERAERMAVRTRLTIEHVMASSALPIVFPAVQLGDEYFGDGSISHLAPLSPALHLGARAIIAIGSPARETPAGAPHSDEYPSAAEVFGILFRAVFLDALEADAERLERINRTISALAPEHPAPDDLHAVELLMLRPTRTLGALAAGRDVLLPRPVRSIIRAIGGHRAAASGFLGYFLFHPEYTSQLIELGYDDVGTHWPEIERFFDRLERHTEGA